MLDRSRNARRPRDLNQDSFGGGGEERLHTPDGRDAAAVMLGRRGGLKGGVARAERLSAEERRSIALKAAKARWAKKDKSDNE
jgi:hypothetical protein